MPNSWKKNVESFSKKKRRGNSSKRECRRYKLTRKYMDSSSRCPPKRRKCRAGCNRGKSPRSFHYELIINNRIMKQARMKRYIRDYMKI